MSANASPETDPTEREQPLCDFCGLRTEQVRRVALDGEYERLRTRHKIQYACPECSAKKDRERERAHPANS